MNCLVLPLCPQGVLEGHLSYSLPHSLSLPLFFPSSHSLSSFFSFSLFPCVSLTSLESLCLSFFLTYLSLILCCSLFVLLIHSLSLPPSLSRYLSLFFSPSVLSAGTQPEVVLHCEAWPYSTTQKTLLLRVDLGSTRQSSSARHESPLASVTLTQHEWQARTLTDLPFVVIGWMACVQSNEHESGSPCLV